MICCFLCLSPSCHFCLTRKSVLPLFSPSGMTGSCVHSVASMFEVECHFLIFLPFCTAGLLSSQQLQCLSACFFVLFLFASAVFMHLAKRCISLKFFTLCLPSLSVPTKNTSASRDQYLFAESNQLCDHVFLKELCTSIHLQGIKKTMLELQE